MAECWIWQGQDGIDRTWRIAVCATNPSLIIGDFSGGKQYYRMIDGNGSLLLPGFYQLHNSSLIKVNTASEYQQLFIAFTGIKDGNCNSCLPPEGCPPGSLDCGDCCLDCASVLGSLQALMTQVQNLN